MKDMSDASVGMNARFDSINCIPGDTYIQADDYQAMVCNDECFFANYMVGIQKYYMENDFADTDDMDNGIVLVRALREWVIYQNERHYSHKHISDSFFAPRQILSILMTTDEEETSNAISVNEYMHKLTKHFPGFKRDHRLERVSPGVARVATYNGDSSDLRHYLLLAEPEEMMDAIVNNEAYLSAY